MTPQKIKETATKMVKDELGRIIMLIEIDKEAGRTETASTPLTDETKKALEVDGYTFEEGIGYCVIKHPETIN